MTVVDLAAGTGKAAMRYAVEEGVERVICLDHDERMLDTCEAVARQTLPAGAADCMRVQCGSAEATGLPDGSCDLVAAHQAFHWFDVPKAMREMHRILRPQGCVAAVWNRKNLSNPCSGSIERAIRQKNPDYEKTFFSAPMASVLHSDKSDTVERDWCALLEDGAAGAFRMLACMQFPFDIVYDGDDDVVSLLETFSYVRSIEPEGKRHLFEQVREIVRDNATEEGRVKLSYITHVYILQRL